MRCPGPGSLAARTTSQVNVIINLCSDLVAEKKRGRDRVTKNEQPLETLYHEILAVV